MNFNSNSVLIIVNWGWCVWWFSFCFWVCLGTPSDTSSIPLPDKKTLQLILDKLQKYGASDFPFSSGLIFHCPIRRKRAASWCCNCLFGQIMTGRTHMVCTQSQLILRRYVRFSVLDYLFEHMVVRRYIIWRRWWELLFSFLFPSSFQIIMMWSSTQWTFPQYGRSWPMDHMQYWTSLRWVLIMVLLGFLVGEWAPQCSNDLLQVPKCAT